MSDVLARLLTGLAALMDKYIPGKGVRTYMLVVLGIIAHINLFLTSQETARVASTNIMALVTVLFAAWHNPTPPAPPGTPPV